MFVGRLRVIGRLRVLIFRQGGGPRPGGPYWNGRMGRRAPGYAAPNLRRRRRIMTRRIASVGVVIVGLIAALGCVTKHYDYAPPPHPHVAHANTQNNEDYEFFYDDLAPYGNWVWIDGPGMVWAPYNVTVGWRPYVEGHWANTDYGWTWASDEPYGWAVYHYGRWHNSANHGWVWVPGRTWGPAWVSWQHGDGWTGWAPLPWRVKWRVGIGLDWGHVHPTHAVRVSAWTFARTGHMVDIHLRNQSSALVMWVTWSCTGSATM